MSHALAARWQASRWLLAGEWRMHPLRALVAIAAIAIGVALGFAIHLINTAAFNEFSAAVKSLSGQSDLQVRAAEPTFDESLYPLLAQRPGVAAASPVLELDATVAGQKMPLTIIGIDVFRAAQVTPDLIGVAADERRFEMLADDAIFLSPAAMEWLGAKPGATADAARRQRRRQAHAARGRRRAARARRPAPGGDGHRRRCNGASAVSGGCRASSSSWSTASTARRSRAR